MNGRLATARLSVADGARVQRRGRNEEGAGRRRQTPRSAKRNRRRRPHGKRSGIRNDLPGEPADRDRGRGERRGEPARGRPRQGEHPAGRGPVRREPAAWSRRTSTRATSSSRAPSRARCSRAGSSNSGRPAASTASAPPPLRNPGRRQLRGHQSSMFSTREAAQPAPPPAGQARGASGARRTADESPRDKRILARIKFFLTLPRARPEAAQTAARPPPPAGQSSLLNIIIKTVVITPWRRGARPHPGRTRACSLLDLPGEPLPESRRMP